MKRTLLIVLPVLVAALWLAWSVPHRSRQIPIAIRIISYDGSSLHTQVVDLEVTNCSTREITFAAYSISQFSGPYTLPGHSARAIQLSEQSPQERQAGMKSHMLVRYRQIPGKFESQVDSLLGVLHVPFRLIRWKRMEVPMDTVPNHPASGNGAVTSPFHAGRSGRAVPEPGRSAEKAAYEQWRT
jgi:hypothetical protein